VDLVERIALARFLNVVMYICSAKLEENEFR